MIKILNTLQIDKNTKTLDIGCGRGDITLYLAKKAKHVVGIDYSKDAIEIAKSIQKKFRKSIQERSEFLIMNAKKLKFPPNSFDLVICIDIFEHLSDKELNLVMKEISRVLKRDGTLFVHTGTNRILYDWTYKYYILPINKLLTWVDQKMKGISYSSLPNDPRTKQEKKQHVNEPTYFYLLNLFNKHKFKGKISADIGYIKEGKGVRKKLYNALVALYPLSKLSLFNILFGWAFTCRVKNKKP